MGNAIIVADAEMDFSEAQATTMMLGNETTRAAVAPTSGAVSLFTVTGTILLLNIIGEVTVVIETKTLATKIQANPSATGSSVDLCATLDITADAVGVLYSITGTAGTAMQGTQGSPSMALPWIIGDGTIDANFGDTGTGGIVFTVYWVPMSFGATVVAA